MISSISVTCPQEIRRINRQARNRKREADPERKAAVKAWCIGKLCSCGCGQPANTPHHPSDDLYQDKWADLSECEPYNNRCHHNLHRGRVRCPSCHGWMKQGREKCSKCEGWHARNLRAGKIRHPCRFNVGRQKCTTRGVCSYSWKKAEGCDYFGKREGIQ